MFHKGKHDREKQLRFSIRKVSFGAASVAVAALFMFLGNGAVSAAEQGVPSTNGETQAPQPKDQNAQNGTYEGNTVATSPAATVETNTQPSTVENSPSTESEPQKVETLDKKELTDLIKEVDGKFAKGAYATKTEGSVNNLRAVLEEARTDLSTATTKTELTAAYRKLITATSKLQTKSEKKKEQAVDTTNGKATVGKKATNTEKAADTNSIANSGSRDERNGKVLDKNNPFRTDTAPSTSDDTSANQTYTLPEDSASVDELDNKLKGLDSSIRNETKLASIDEVGRFKNVQPGKIQEIDEFGGWSAITADGKKGKFAIARKTDAGVYPIETVNVTRKGAGENGKYVIHVEENAFDRSNEYALFLSKVRTYATKDEETIDGQPFKDVDTDGGVGEALTISRGLKGFNGIEKTYKAYSPSTGTGINISFKTGFTGDIDGVKAGYKVEVIAKFKDGRTKSIYNESFLPTDSKNDRTKNVVPVDANDNAKFEVKRSPKPTVDTLNQQLATYKNSQVNKTGSFTSKNIDLPKGAIEYTVRISASDNSKLGMGYQTTWSQYALPIAGRDFSIEQDTKNVAKDLLQRIYNKLVEQKSEDTKWSTPETKDAYETKLTEIKTLLSSEISTTRNYKESAKSLIEKYKSLNNRDKIVAAAKADLAEAAKAEKAEIAADKSLTEAERKEKETAVDTKKAEEEAKITAAENADKVAEAKTAGVTAIKGVHTPGNLDTVKEAAKADLEKAAQAEKAEIAADKSLTEAERKEKETAVDTKKAEEEAKITAAENADKVAEAKTAGETAIKGVHTPGNLDTVKEAAKAEIDAALAEKEKAIEANDKLSDAEKAAAKEEAKKAADEAKKAIEAATDQTGVDAKATEGTKAVAAVNPVGKEKAKAAVDAALAEKEKAIEANDKLSDAEKAAAKAEAKKAADEAKKAIEAATDQTGVDAKAAEGKAAVAAVNPVGKDKAKEEVEGELAKKLAELENSTDLTDAEKATAKTRVLDEAKKAIEVIEKAMTQAEVDQAIRNFVYRISAVVLEKEEYDLSKLFVNGSVIVKQGETLADKDILSKLNLPEGVEVVKVEKPETVALGKGTAKVTLKLADGTQVTITVPVEVVKGSTTSGITKLSSEVVKTGETEESSNKVSNKQLPNTGTAETNTGLVGLGLGILGLLAAARRRKEK